MSFLIRDPHTCTHTSAVALISAALTIDAKRAAIKLDSRMAHRVTECKALRSASSAITKSGKSSAEVDEGAVAKDGAETGAGADPEADTDAEAEAEADSEVDADAGADVSCALSARFAACNGCFEVNWRHGSSGSSDGNRLRSWQKSGAAVALRKARARCAAAAERRDDDNIVCERERERKGEGI